MTNQREHPDGRVEITDTTRVERSSVYNEDLAPVPIARRNWTTYNYAALWISMAHCIPTYMLSAGLMAAGMSWAQALFTVALGNTIVLIPILLGRHLLALGLPPGPRIGEILKAVYEQQLDGTVTTRDQAIAAANRIVSANP